MNVTDSLFSANEGLEHIPMQDAEVYYWRRFLPAEMAYTVMRQLVEEVPWRAEKITVWGKTFAQPRLITWYGDRGKSYTYSGIHLNALPWTPTLLDLKSKVEAVAGTDFNSVLLNYYRNHRDSMGFHSDDEQELGQRPIIASVSLGEERTFILTGLTLGLHICGKNTRQATKYRGFTAVERKSCLKHKTDKALKPVRLKLVSGSLLLMKGGTQHYWKHGIDKEARPCEPHINLTFRHIRP